MKEKIKENKYYQLGLTIFMVIGACILFTFIIFNIDKIWKFLGTIVGLFSPFIIGFVFAYLLNPIVIFFKKNVFDKFVKKYKVANNLSLLTTPVSKLIDFKEKKENPVVLLSTGGFDPIHDGHIYMMEFAKEALEKKGYHVIGGYLSPSHESYVSTKPYYKINAY